MAKPYSPKELRHIAAVNAKAAAADFALNRSCNRKTPVPEPEVGPSAKKARPTRGTVGQVGSSSGSSMDVPEMMKPSSKARPQDHVLNGLQGLV